MAFECNKCGACCRKVHKAPETMHLDRGDGVCWHYDSEIKQCRIYEARPDICRVGLQYVLNYSERFTWEEFCRLNQLACSILAEE